MLFTRCPDCETTFRITADALRKANGQVRCGRCARVFNAYHELRRRTRKTVAAPRENADAADAGTASAVTSAAAGESVAPAGSGAAGTKSAEPAAKTAEPAAAGEAEARSAARTGQAAAAVGQALPDVVHRLRTASPKSRNSEPEKDVVVGDISLSGVIAELAASAASDDADADEAAKPAAPDRPARRGSLLEKNGLPVPAAPPRRSGPGRKAHPAGGGTDEPAAPAWVILEETPAKRRVGSRIWAAGAVGAAVLLALQVVHHYRNDLAALAVIGPAVREAYAMLGAELAPDWNLDQYELVVDWDAVTPNADGEGSFKIAARIRNKGPSALPLPHVQVELKDRWESTLGRRVFSPAEYLPQGAVVHRSMTAGQTALAELAIVDPGPQAYGFELDVCVAAQAGALRCAADEIFR